MENKIIWIVNEYNGPNVGPRTRQTVLSQYLTENGYEVYIIAGSTDYKGGNNSLKKGQKLAFVDYDGAHFVTIRTSNYNRGYQRVLVALQFQRRVWKLRNCIPKPDVIVSDFAGLFGNVFLKWKRKYGTRIIFDILDLWPEGFVNMGYLSANSQITRVLYEMEHRSYREADSIIFSMQGGRDYIIDKGWDKDVDISTIGYLNNGVDLATFDRQKYENIINDPDLDADKFKVVYLGSISAFNGLDVLVEAANVLQKRNEDNIVIYIYGYGNQEEKLTQMATNYGLTNIKFKGKLEKKYGPYLLTHSDLNVYTFVDMDLLKYGVSPNKLFMYFASAKPVLSMITPAYDLVVERGAGSSVQNNPETIADEILRFSKMSKKEYQRFCECARSVAEEYDYKLLVKELITRIEG